jgi:hypothetical protein
VRPQWVTLAPDSSRCGGSCGRNSREAPVCGHFQCWRWHGGTTGVTVIGVTVVTPQPSCAVWSVALWGCSRQCIVYVYSRRGWGLNQGLCVCVVCMDTWQCGVGSYSTQGSL